MTKSTTRRARGSHGPKQDLYYENPSDPDRTSYTMGNAVDPFIGDYDYFISDEVITPRGGLEQFSERVLQAAVLDRSGVSV